MSAESSIAQPSLLMNSANESSVHSDSVCWSSIDLNDIIDNSVSVSNIVDCEQLPVLNDIIDASSLPECDLILDSVLPAPHHIFDCRAVPDCQDVLGLHAVSVSSSLPLQIPQLFKEVHISYPNPHDKNTYDIPMEPYWDGLCESSCYWNINDRVSKKGGKLSLCPPMPQVVGKVHGNLELAKQRAATDPVQDIAREYQKWYKQTKPLVAENDLFLKMYDVLQHETGSLFLGFTTENYSGILTPALGLSLYSSIETGLSSHWLSMARLKGVDLTDVEFGKGQVTIQEFRQTLEQQHNNRDALMRSRLFKKQNVLRLTADLLFRYISSLDPLLSFPVKLARLTDDQIENAYRIQFIKIYGREVDLYCLLPQRKLIIQIEIKDGKNNVQNENYNIEKKTMQ